MLKCINFEGLGVGNEWYVTGRTRSDIAISSSSTDSGKRTEPSKRNWREN